MSLRTRGTRRLIPHGQNILYYLISNFLIGNQAPSAVPQHLPVYR